MELDSRQAGLAHPKMYPRFLGASAPSSRSVVIQSRIGRPITSRPVILSAAKDRPVLPARLWFTGPPIRPILRRAQDDRTRARIAHSLNQHPQRVLQDRLELLHEARGGGAVEGAVVESRASVFHRLPDDRLAVSGNNLGLGRATARIAASGEFRIAVKWSIPNMPRLLIVRCRQCIRPGQLAGVGLVGQQSSLRGQAG